MTTADGGPWVRIASTLLYVMLIFACLDAQTHATLLTLAKRTFFVQEIQLIRLSRKRPLVLGDVWNLPERLGLFAIQREFKYNVEEPMFLLRAIVRMAWRPMLPLLTIWFLMEAGSIAEVVVTGCLLRCFDSASDYPWYHGYGAALALLIIKMICLQHSHIRDLIRGELFRVVNAIRLELFRLPLEPNGQRRLADINVVSSAIAKLPWSLTWLAQTCVQAVGFWPKFAALYYVVGPLALIPIVSSVVIRTISWGFELLVGPSHHWSTPNSTYDERIGEVYLGIKAIKLFGWERMYLDPKLEEQDSDATRLPWYAPAVRIACAYVLELSSHVNNLYVTLRVSGGEVVAVVGKTGAGKSSLLLSICGELEMTAGTGSVAGTIAYLEQSPWIMNDTMRANVLFGREYDAEFFARVIHACALTEDIAMWPDADLTVIGERGVDISGGQRARLALARTVYSRADIYVFDDPISAVDAHVKRHILEHVLLDTGMLAGKLRIVTTNSGHILPYAHQVVTLTDGRAEVTTQSPQEIINMNIKSTFVRSIIHAPMSFFDSTTRQHVSSAYNDGAKELAEEIPRF
ncbi:ATP-binding cassette glutathione S-conjugate transporter ycf1, partial [Coemansia helicoidea]